MAQFSLKFGKVWKVYSQNGYTKIDVRDSKKNPKSPSGYDNCTWFGLMLVGNAKDFVVEEGDKVNVEGQIFTNKVGEKYYTNITVFGISHSDGEKKKESINNDIDFEDDDEFPF